MIADGVFRPELSELPLSGAITVRSLDEPAPIDGDDPLLLLNTAFFTGGVRIEVAAGENVTLPVEVISVNTGMRAETFAPRIEAVIHLLNGVGERISYSVLCEDRVPSIARRHDGADEGGGAQ